MTDPLFARVQSSFDRSSMLATLGARLTRVEPGLVEIRAPILPGSRQQQGFAHAGLSFTIGDTAAGYAALTQAVPGHEILTVEIKINLLAPGMGDELVATGRVERAGRRVSVVTAEVVALTGGTSKTVALLQGTMMPVPA
ncbi:phenylacetic acid degradation protein [Oceanicola sp. 22II-s10i]|uniref:PaaI family thioesterase n=1 Tax=Oceanicola sp. 22II-s10i TaxID=1317116 RepID=UPI000B528E8B|nr:PaaI family thioesterase [Oceanicola sp. 22II-s10i]OWU85464.1 phenylacetic acid degradation protein [Oceanicola sp. 22II-s10i]